MNLDELKAQWEACDLRLTECIQLNARQLRESGLHRTRGSLGWLSVGVVVELVLGVLLLLVIGSYLADHFGQPRFFLPALTLKSCLDQKQLGIFPNISHVVGHDHLTGNNAA